MRQAARTALVTSALFLVVVAIMLNSAALFYMSTAILGTILMARLQSYRSVRGLRFDRHAPDTVKVGEVVKVEITIWSERRIRRPLVVIEDVLPPKMVMADLSASLPIAPAFDVPIQSQYTFRPLRRGRFRWSQVKVLGTDALGLVTSERTYDVSAVEMMVLPSPMPVDFEIPPAPAYGISESETGLGRGSGIEPRGVREYSSGDSLRYVHWRSSARAGKLLVKEFATGSYSATSFVIQRTHQTDIGVGAATTLEQICANAAFMADRMLRQGGEISFPTLTGTAISSSVYNDHNQRLLAILATVEADSDMTIAEEVEQARRSMPAGGLIFAFLSIADDALPQEVRRCLASGIQVVAMLYDADEYLPPRSGNLVNTAGSIHYIEALTMAGAKVQLVPKPESL
ncbi:MAG TPA: DUF58 domain-containing protein [Fimbriimonadaceae bacterium]|jgi:uncharacterized protein (DUF58 family)